MKRGISLIGAWAWLAIACTNLSHTTVAASDAATPTAPATLANSATSSAAAQIASPEKELFALTRGQRWALAAEWFDRHWATSEPRPKLRFLRAMIAAELGDHESTVRWLSKLEQELPVLSEEILSARLAAEAEVLPSEEALLKLAKSGRFQDVLKAVAGFRRLSMPAKALAVVVENLPRLRRTAPEPEAVRRLLRAQADVLVELSRPSEAAAVYKELATSHVVGEAAAGCDAAYEQWSKVRLTKAQRFARAEKFGEAERVDLLEAELERMQQAPGSPLSATQVKRSRAWAYYKSRKDYSLAAELFLETSKADQTYRIQDLFFSARALSRSHQDEAAAARYSLLAKTYPASSYAEQARYLGARVHYVKSDFKQAEAGFLDYLKRYDSRRRSGKYEPEVLYELSVTRLALGRGSLAIADLKRLVQRSQKDREKAQLNHLLGVALSQAKQTEAAVAVFTSVIEQRPLSFSALVSASRLREMGKTPPPAMPEREPAPAPDPLIIELSDKTKVYLELGLHLAAERELDAQAAALAFRHGPDSARALCQAYATLATAKSLYRHGLQSVRERAVMQAVGPDTQWIWDCIYPRPYSDLVSAQEQQRELPQGLVHAVMRQESAFKSTAVSHAGAVGLMQLMPPTARSIAGELGRELQAEPLTSPALNVEFGAFYLAKLLKRFAGDIPVAVASYNAGPAAVSRWLQGAEDLPLDLFVARIPYDETRGYVYRVIGNLARYRYLRGGLSSVPQLSLALPKQTALQGADY